MSALNKTQALVGAVSASNAKSENLIRTLDGIIDKMEAKIAYWKTVASWVDIYGIVDDVKRGKFSHPEDTTTRYYNNGQIEVTAQVDSDFYPIKLEVLIIDEEGEDHPLCSEQYNFIYTAWEKELIEAEKEARSEAEHIKHLRETCV